jgi:DNA mismatch repair ATPase MutS
VPAAVLLECRELLWEEPGDGAHDLGGFARMTGQLDYLASLGYPVPSSSACAGLFTHYKREEDAAMERGKLDEELDRMSVITDRIRPDGLLLCSESFASPNEREGSQLAREIIRARAGAGIRIVFVTHMYDLAESIHARRDDRVEHDDSRTHRLSVAPASDQPRR